MKRIAIMLLFSAMAAGQLVDHMPVTHFPDDRTLAIGIDENGKSLEARVAALEQRTALQLRVLGEFSLMEVELKQLNDKRVKRIMHRHLAEIEKLVVQMKKLDEAK